MNVENRTGPVTTDHPGDSCNNRLDPDSFGGKLLLLVLDKVVIGAIVALAFLLYNNWKTADERRFTAQMAVQARDASERSQKLQLDLERARLTRDLVPTLSNPAVDLSTKAYLLQAAVTSRAIDPDSAVELGGVLLDDGLSGRLFTRVLEGSMPAGAPTVAREATRRVAQWQAAHPQESRSFGRQFCNPACRQATHLDAWNAVFITALPKIDARLAEFNDRKQVHAVLPELITLLEHSDESIRARLLHSDALSVKVAGLILSILAGAPDPGLRTLLEFALFQPEVDPEGMSFATAVIDSLYDSPGRVGHWVDDSVSGTIAMAAVAHTGDSFESFNLSDSAFNWLQTGVCSGELSAQWAWVKVITAYVDKFQRAVMEAKGALEIRNLALRHKNTVVHAVALLSQVRGGYHLRAETGERVGKELSISSLKPDRCPEFRE